MKEFILNLLLAIDRNLIEYIKIPTNGNLKSNEKSLEELSKIVKICEEKNIFVGILGSWALTMYSNKEFKNIEDIDLVTNDTSLKSLQELLTELGYRETSSNWPNMHYFEKRGLGIDIFSVDNKKHIYYGLPCKIVILRYQEKDYPVVSKESLYQMYKRVFMKPKRSVKRDLIKFKILRKYTG